VRLRLVRVCALVVAAEVNIFEEMMDSVLGGIENERDDKEGCEKTQPANAKSASSKRFHLDL